MATHKVRSILTGELIDYPDEVPEPPESVSALIDEAEKALANLRAAAEEMRRPVIQVVQPEPKPEAPSKVPTLDAFDLKPERDDVGLIRAVDVSSEGMPVGRFKVRRNDMMEIAKIEFQPEGG